MSQVFGEVTVDRGGLELLSAARPLWEALYDRHLEYGAAGLATIAREDSWPLRVARYERIFTDHRHPVVFLASIGGEPIGYALAFSEDDAGSPAVVLETLSLLPRARGRGVGSQLMELVDEDARTYGATRGFVDVVTGNSPAFGFYIKAGFEPHSEMWMRSSPPEKVGQPATAGLPAEGTEHPTEQLPQILVAKASELGFTLGGASGPDDTWVSSRRIAELTWFDRSGTRPIAKLSATRIRELVDALAEEGLWTVQVWLPTEPASDHLRAALNACGFTPAMERLTRTL